MRTQFRQVALLGGIVSLLFLSQGCPAGSIPGPEPGGGGGRTVSEGGGSKAAPPAPPAEVPSALQLPESVAIGVDTTRSATGALTLESLVAPDGEFSYQIAFSSNIVFLANQKLNGLLGPLSRIVIPTSPPLTHMEVPYFFVGDKSYTVRLNFENFDLDGVGGEEGCFGDTGHLPLCIRIWLDDGVSVSRLFAARIDNIRVSPGSPIGVLAAGSLRGRDLIFSGLGAPINAAADFDQVDPLNKQTDSFFGVLDESDLENPTLSYSFRAFASQVGEEAMALKTTNGNLDADRGLGRWIEGQDFWSGSFSGSSDTSRDIHAQCAVIETGKGVDSSNCVASGIDVDLLPPLDFLGFSTVNDVGFFDFPLTPP